MNSNQSDRTRITVLLACNATEPDHSDPEELHSTRSNSHGHSCGRSRGRSRGCGCGRGRGRGRGRPRLSNATPNSQQSRTNRQKTLDDSQIVETVLAEELEYEQGDPEDSGEEPPKISAFEGLNGLKPFFSFVEQMDNNFFFNNNDIKIFRKYLQLMRRITTESMEQKSIVDFFNQENQAINDKYLEDNFSGNNNDDEFSDNGNYGESDDIYLSDNFPNYDSLPDYNFSDYDDFSDNYSSSSDDYEN
ncbi:hypothetical protein C2G38_2286162 [Gigaspora rosea]|uniref:Uncharacterized protein n=1 Tax=Gigaspora rosea TaxID=44941 RepID=A0A397VQ97_9GLOM|nr:hypothetical protein C2G38_2286162 [Gigaspora rosea]